MSAKGRCRRKVARLTVESANEALAERQSSFPEQDWEIYTCPVCKHFHVGTKDTAEKRMKRNPGYLRRIAERKNAL